MASPEPGLYTVGVELFRGPGDATLTFECGEEVRRVFGPRALEFDEDDRVMWEVLQFNPSDCSLRILNQVRPFECGRGGCQCNECDAGPCNGDACPLGGCDVETGVCEDLCAAVECDADSFCNTETGECVGRDIANCDACETEVNVRQVIGVFVTSAEAVRSADIVVQVAKMTNVSMLLMHRPQSKWAPFAHALQRTWPVLRMCRR